MLRDAANFQVMEKIVHSDAKLFRVVLHHKGGSALAVPMFRVDRI